MNKSAKSYVCQTCEHKFKASKRVAVSKSGNVKYIYVSSPRLAVEDIEDIVKYGFFESKDTNKVLVVVCPKCHTCHT